MGFLFILSKSVPLVTAQEELSPGPLGQSLAATLGRFCDDASDEELTSPDGCSQTGKMVRNRWLEVVLNVEMGIFRRFKSRKIRRRKMASDFC